MVRNFSPKKYGMIFCPNCSGKGCYGSTHHEKEVCSMCGGFGLIKKENFGNEENQKIMRRTSDCP